MSAHEKYRRPSLFALFMGMLVAFAARLGAIRPPRVRAPRLRLPGGSRLRARLGPVTAALGRLVPARLKQIRPAGWPWVVRLGAYFGRVGAFLRHPIAGVRAWLPKNGRRVVGGGGLFAARPIVIPAFAPRLPKITRENVRAAARSSAAFLRANIGNMLMITVIAAALVGLVWGLTRLVPPLAAFARAQWSALFEPEPVYRVSAPEPPALLDAQRAVSRSEIGHLRLIFEGLTRYDQYMQTVPAAASQWSYSPDGRVITFTLREGLTYSDGSVLNALRFEDALLRAIDPRTGTEYAAQLDGIQGAWGFHDFDLSSSPEAFAERRDRVSIESRDMNNTLCTAYTQADCRQLIITLTAPDYAFHTRAAIWQAYPQKLELVGSGEWYFDKNRLIGNGPFVLTALDSGVQAVFAPNARYWGAKPGYGVRVTYNPDTAAALAQYQAGALDVLPLDGDGMAAALADPALGRDLRRTNGTCTFGIMIDATMPPFDDPAVRAAFAHALSREAYAGEVFGNQVVPAITWIPPTIPGHAAQETRWAYDPALARQKLAESSYHDAAGLPAITVAFTSTPLNNAHWGWLKARWQDVLGVTVTLDPRPVGELYATPLAILGRCGDLPDPSNYLEYWHSTGFAARFNYANPAVNALLDQARLTADAAQRMSLYSQAQDQVFADLPVITLYHTQRAFLFRPDRLPYNTPDDILFPLDVDPAALVAVTGRIYMPMIGD